MSPLGVAVSNHRYLSSSETSLNLDTKFWRYDFMLNFSRLKHVTIKAMI
jgi:hypothetical protein